MKNWDFYWRRQLQVSCITASLPRCVPVDEVFHELLKNPDMAGRMMAERMRLHSILERLERSAARQGGNAR
jgi:hypothetical protein